ncbi:MAG TPA: hypothetical protein VGK33_11305, partial [Chloroflexota bacterium]
PITQAISPVLQPVVEPLDAALQPVVELTSPVPPPVVGSTDPSPPSAAPGPAAQPLPATPDNQPAAQPVNGDEQVSGLLPAAAVPPETEAVSPPPAIVPPVIFSAQPADDTVRGARLSGDNRMGDAPASALDSNPALPSLELDPTLVPALSGATQIAASALPTQTVSGTTPVDLAGAVPSVPSEAANTNAPASANPTVPVPDAPVGAAVNSPESVAHAAAPSDPIYPRQTFANLASPTSANLASGETNSTSGVPTLTDHGPGFSWQPSSNQPLNPSPGSGSPPAPSTPVTPVTFTNGMASSSGSLAGGGSSSAVAALTGAPDPLATTRSALKHAEALLPASNIPETVTPPR